MGRDARQSSYERSQGVSIHAPTWGATPGTQLTFLTIYVSIHAPTWGATVRHVPYDVAREFQSTRPRGARHVVEDARAYAVKFQSTRPRGARHTGKQIFLPMLVSIHAPTWGATASSIKNNSNQHVSIHAPTWGATVANREVCHGFEFQSTRPRGARLV